MKAAFFLTLAIALPLSGCGGDASSPMSPSSGTIELGQQAAYLAALAQKTVHVPITIGQENPLFITIP